MAVIINNKRVAGVGKPGIPGKSAYELARQTGYEGSELDLSLALNKVDDIAQSDWNVHDQNDPAYVKNRTHYDSRNTINLIEGSYASTSGLYGYSKVADTINFDVNSVDRMTFDCTVNPNCGPHKFINVPVTVEYGGQGYNILYQSQGHEYPSCMAVYLETNDDANYWFGSQDHAGSGFYVWSGDDGGYNVEFTYSFGFGEGSLKTLDAKYLPDQMIVVEYDYGFEDEPNVFAGRIVNKTNDEIEALWDRLYSGTSNDSPVIYYTYGPYVFLAPLTKVEAMDAKSLYFVGEGKDSVIYFHVFANNGYVDCEIVNKDPVGKNVSGTSYEIEGETVSAKSGAEVFNHYSSNIAVGKYSHAEGSRTTASGDYSHAEGYKTVASGNSSHAEGSGAKAIGESSHAEGGSSKANGVGSHAEGIDTQANGESAHAEGSDTEANGESSHAEGRKTRAEGSYSHAEGYGSFAEGESSHAEGGETQANGDYSHAEGEGTEANGRYSHAEGKRTTASGDSAHAEGEKTEASGESAHAEGSDTVASGNYSHAEGSLTTAASDYQHVQGRNNILDEEAKYIHIVGNGDSGSFQSNAHTLDWAGNAWFAGDVYVSSTSGTNKDEGSKKVATESYVDSKIEKFEENFTPLPAGYTRIQYIESTGTQFINTSFYPSGNKYRVVMTFMYTRGHGSLSLFGNSTGAPFSITAYGITPTFYVGNSSSIYCGDEPALNTLCVLDITADNGVLTALWNGVEYTASYSGDLRTTDPVLVFGAGTGGIAGETGNGYRLYSMKIYDNNNLVRNFVPCVGGDGSLGLFDMANGTFYTNAGSGEFLSDYVGEITPIEKGGTGATDAETARANLGITPANIGAPTVAEMNTAISNAINTAFANIARAEEASF